MMSRLGRASNSTAKVQSSIASSLRSRRDLSKSRSVGYGSQQARLDRTACLPAAGRNPREYLACRSFASPVVARQPSWVKPLSYLLPLRRWRGGQFARRILPAAGLESPRVACYAKEVNRREVSRRKRARETGKAENGTLQTENGEGAPMAYQRLVEQLARGQNRLLREARDVSFG